MISPLCQFIEALKKRARHREPYLLSYPNEGLHGLHTMCVALQVTQVRPDRAHLQVWMPTYLSQLMGLQALVALAGLAVSRWTIPAGV